MKQEIIEKIAITRYTSTREKVMAMKNPSRRWAPSPPWEDLSEEEKIILRVGMQETVALFLDSIEGVPSVEEIIGKLNTGEPWGVKEVRNLLLASFAKQLAEKDSELATVNAERAESRELRKQMIAAQDKLWHIAKLPEKWRIDSGLNGYCSGMQAVKDLESILSATPAVEPVPTIPTYHTSNVVQQRREDAAAINAVMNPKKPSTSRIKELADIGARAASKSLSPRLNSVLVISEECSIGWEVDRPAREAFAQAIVDEVRKESPWGANGGTMEAWMTKQREKGNAAEKEIENLRDDVAKWINEVERSNEYGASKACEVKSLEKEIIRLTAELAQKEERLAKLGPRPVSVRPTKADADKHERVVLIGSGGVCTQALYTNWTDIHESWTHWLPCSLSAYGMGPPTAEETMRAEFEAWWLKDSENVEYPISHQVIAEKAWQAARASKEVKEP